MSRRISVLVIDDSARNRQLVRAALAEAPDVEVVGHARDGDEGLKMVTVLRPDVVTLDLEMPRLDGFAFLRLLRANQPTPVIVVSSYAHTSDVFKALELGAYDFVAKPDLKTLARFSEELLEKIRAVRQVRQPKRRAPSLPEPDEPCVLAVGASTGGPAAVQRLLESLGPEPSLCILVAQHMPSGFTKAFAERLDRLGPFSVAEARSGDVPAPGQVFVAPGGKHLVVHRARGKLSLAVVNPHPRERHAPSVDVLFDSVAKALGPRAVGVVLTGMGSDGAAGAKAIAHAGGEVLAESEETAVIFGMPKEAIASGAVRRILPLGMLGEAVRALVRRRRRADAAAEDPTAKHAVD